MAESANIGNLSLDESRHAGPPSRTGRAPYIPPHLRQSRPAGRGGGGGSFDNSWGGG